MMLSFQEVCRLSLLLSHISFLGEELCDWEARPVGVVVGVVVGVGVGVGVGVAVDVGVDVDVG